MLELKERERQILESAVTDVRKLVKEHEALQSALQQKYQEVVSGGSAVNAVFRTVLRLRGLNPDAYKCEWSLESDRVAVSLKEPVLPPISEAVEGGNGSRHSRPFKGPKG